MPVPLPPKIFQILAPAIKGNVGVARQVKFRPFLKVFSGHFGCSVEQRQGNLLKVSPPAEGRGIWLWRVVPFFMRKPANGTLVREDLYRLRKTFKTLYNWDNKNIVCGPCGRGGRP